MFETLEGLMEAKVALCMILQRFSFSLSPSYKHEPTVVLTLQPKNGMQIIFKSIDLYKTQLQTFSLLGVNYDYIVILDVLKCKVNRE